MAAVVGCLVIRSGPFSVVCCLLLFLWLFGLMFPRRCLADVLCAPPFLSEWEIVERIYRARGKDSVVKTCFLVIRYYMVLMCVALVVDSYE